MPKLAKLADFSWGHFIRFWNRGQAGIVRVSVCGKGRASWGTHEQQVKGEKHRWNTLEPHSSVIVLMSPVVPVGHTATPYPEMRRFAPKPPFTFHLLPFTRFCILTR